MLTGEVLPCDVTHSADEVARYAEIHGDFLRRVENLARSHNLMVRLWKQALLTAGGEVKIDPQLADAAKADERNILFGSGGVRFDNDNPPIDERFEKPLVIK